MDISPAEARAELVRRAELAARQSTIAWAKLYQPQVRIASGAEIRFQPFPYQAELLEVLDAGGPVIVNKARQIGVSTDVMMQKTRRICTTPGLTVLVVSRKAQLASELLDRARLVYATLRGEKPAVKIDNRLCFELANGSRIVGETASENTGRTYAASDVLFDEFAHCAWQEEMWRSVRPTVAQAGGNIIVVSTPNGEGDKFHELWLQATGGNDDVMGRCELADAGWVAFRLPWQAHPDRHEPWLAAERPHYTQADWAQEFECSFLSVTAAIFAAEDLAAAVKLWRPGGQGRLILSVDVAGEGRDFTVLTLLDITRKPWCVLGQRGCEQLGAVALQTLIEKEAAETGAEVALDGTGLGWGVSENLAVRHKRVIFTGGEAVTRDGSTWRVPREKLIINALQLIERHELGLPAEGQELITALRTARWDKRAGSYVDYLDSLLVGLWIAAHAAGSLSVAPARVHPGR